MGFFDRFFGPPSKERFAKLFASALRRAGDNRIATFDKAENRLIHTKDGEEVGITNLQNLYTEYCNAPRGERKAMLARVCKAILNPMEMPEEFEDVKPDLLPTLRTRFMLEVLRLDTEIAGNAPMALPAVPLTENLVVCLVYDMPSTMKFVTQDNLDTWGVTFDEALDVARANLIERPANMLSVGDKLFIMANGDSYDGTRVLLTEQIRSLKLSGQPVAMPVTRDSLLIAGSDDVEGLTMMLTVAEKKQGEARPLCPIPLRLNDEWETWKLPVNHSLYGQFKEQELRHVAGEYEEQKGLLEKRNEKAGVDVFVASFSALRKNDELLSYCVWSKTVPTWLPKTDFVSLFDPETKKSLFIRWERLFEVAGSIMQPLQYFPPRFFVDDFPSEEQIAQMEAEDWTK